nr:hypothetical protein [Tanacetum cinerariifolium]
MKRLTDKWATTELKTKWGNKWEERFFGDVGSRQRETWHVTLDAQRMFYNVIKMGFDMDGLIESLHNQVKNE